MSLGPDLIVNLAPGSTASPAAAKPSKGMGKDDFAGLVDEVLADDALEPRPEQRDDIAAVPAVIRVGEPAAAPVTGPGSSGTEGTASGVVGVAPSTAKPVVYVDMDVVTTPGANFTTALGDILGFTPDAPAGDGAPDAAVDGVVADGVADAVVEGAVEGVPQKPATTVTVPTVIVDAVTDGLPPTTIDGEAAGTAPLNGAVTPSASKPVVSDPAALAIQAGASIPASPEPDVAVTVGPGPKADVTVPVTVTGAVTDGATVEAMPDVKAPTPAAVPASVTSDVPDAPVPATPAAAVAAAAVTTIAAAAAPELTQSASIAAAGDMVDVTVSSDGSEVSPPAPATAPTAPAAPPAITPQKAVAPEPAEQAAAPDEAAAPSGEPTAEDLQSEIERPRAEASRREVEPAPGRNAQTAAPEARAGSPTSNHIVLPENLAARAAMPVAQTPVAQAAGVMPGLSVAVAAEIVAQHRGGASRFEIRLDPPELGRIDVRLEVDRAGRVRSSLRVERAETLDLLRNDLRGLEKALEQAGLRSDAGSVSLGLRDDRGSSGHQARSFHMELPQDGTDVALDGSVEEAALPAPGRRASGAGGPGVDIRA